MATTAAKKSKNPAPRRVRSVCRKIQNEWTRAERERRGRSAERMQLLLAAALGLQS